MRWRGNGAGAVHLGMRDHAGERGEDREEHIIAFDVAYRNGDYRSAIAIAGTLASMPPMEAWQLPIALRTAECHEAIGERRSAIACYRSVAMWYEQHHHRDRAIAALEKILALPALDPCEAARTNLKIADLHQWNGDETLAREYRRRASEHR